MDLKILVGIVLLAAVAFVAFSVSAKPQSGARVCVIAPLTGPYALYGGNMTAGLQDALAVGGGNVDVPVDDSRGDVKSALSSYARFRSQGCAVFVTELSGIVGALAPLAERDGVILIYDTITPDFAENYSGVFKVFADSRRDASLMLSIVNDSGKGTAIAYVNTPSGAVFLADVKKRLADADAIPFDAGTMDFRDVITKMKARGYKRVFLEAYANQHPAFFRQMDELGYSPQELFTTSDTTLDVAWGAFLGHASNLTTYYVVGYETWPADYNYLYGYDTGTFLAKGMSTCKAEGRVADDFECLSRVLPTLKFRGKTGLVDMNGTRVALTESHLYRLDGQRLVRVD